MSESQLDPPYCPGRRSAGACLSLLLPLAVAACATTSGTHPHDMSAAEHERAAEHDEQLAEAHARQYDEDAGYDRTACGEFCFSSWSNPTAEHANLARKHRELAAKHRAASEALRNAEADACEGIPERDRDISPFFHTGDIVGLELAAASEPEGPVTYRVHFRTIEGVDADNMQRLLDCHIARNAVRGHDAPEMPYCPLVPKGVAAKAEAGTAGVDVVLTVDAPAHYEVEQRLRHLAAEGGKGQEAQ